MVDKETGKFFINEKGHLLEVMEYAEQVTIYNHTLGQTEKFSKIIWAMTQDSFKQVDKKSIRLAHLFYS